jgi:HK97 family phage major capsid protein
MSLPNTANAIARGTLFPAEIAAGFLNMVKGKSSLAALCGQSPIPFNGSKTFTFSMDNEIDVVAEAGAKSAGGGQVGAVTIQPIKVEYGMRVSDEFIFGSEEVALDILRAFADGWAVKLAKGFDIMAMHGVNPRTGLAASGTIGNNHFDYAAGTKITYLGSSSTAYQNVDAAIAGINGADHEATGAVMGSTIRAALAAMVDTNTRPVFPELAWGGRPSTLNGLRTEFNGPTVEYNSAKTRAVIGDFANYFKWGIAKEMPMEVIQYGNPDNDATAGDLKGHNQVYLRGEAFIGWGILDGSAFATIATA